MDGQLAYMPNQEGVLLLQALNSMFQIFEVGAPATSEQIAFLLSQFPNTPDDFLEVIREGAYMELLYGECDELRVWSPEYVSNMFEAHQFQNYIPEAVPLADDGGGGVYTYMNGNQGWGIYLVRLSNIDRNDAVWVALSLRDILVDGTGITPYTKD